jgi:ACT domain-containing protein
MVKVDVEIELPDKPGQLVKVLDSIAKFGGNITSVYHHRERKKGDAVPISVGFEIREPKKTSSILSTIKRQGFTIKRAEFERKTFDSTIILIGHVFTTGITDTINQIMATKTVVKKVDARIKDVKNVSSVKLTLQANSKEVMKRGIEVINSICREKDLRMIRSI